MSIKTTHRKYSIQDNFNDWRCVNTETLILCTDKCEYQKDGICCYNSTVVNSVYNLYCHKNHNSNGK